MLDTERALRRKLGIEPTIGECWIPPQDREISEDTGENLGGAAVSTEMSEPIADVVEE